MENLILSGYALCWDEKAFIEKDSHNRFYEQFQRGAFSKSIENGNQKVLLFHKRIYEIESRLTLLEDEKGLAFRIDLPNSSEGRFYYNLVRDGTINHVSIGFHNDEVELGQYRHFNFRSVKKAELREISLVTDPAYKTSIVRAGCDNSRLDIIVKINRALKI
jgi:uncharacterized protein